jgi:chaperonin GroEL (HSP60 family)
MGNDNLNHLGYDVKDYRKICSKGIHTPKALNCLINAVSASNNLLRTNNVVTLKKIRSKWKINSKGKALNLIVVEEILNEK